MKPNTRDTTAAALGSVREDPTVLAYPPDPKRGPRGFVVARSRPMDQKRGRAEGSFVRETSAQAVEFYRDLVPNLKPWHAPAPKLRTEVESTETKGIEVAIVPAWVGEPPAAARDDGTSVVPSDGDLTHGFAP
jgi:hypothetical protein